MRGAAAAALAAAMILIPAVAKADPETDVGASGSSFFVGITNEFGGASSNSPGGAGGPDSVPAVPTSNFPAEALPEIPCYGPAAVANLTEALECPTEESDAPTLTPGMVAAAFARIPLPPSALLVQPPNGRTLVNFATNFYTDTETFTRTVTLLGQRVRLDITPASFSWRFGDGQTKATTSPGAPYPDLEITHTYQRKGRVTPSVDTTYTATYRVNGGPSQPVPGTVTIPGEPVPLRIVTATPHLVG